MSRNYFSNDITRIFNMKPNQMNSQNEGNVDGQQEERTIKEIQNIGSLNHPYFPRINYKFQKSLGSKNLLQNFSQPQKGFEEQSIKTKEQDENYEGLTLEDIIKKHEVNQVRLQDESKDQEQLDSIFVDQKQYEEQAEEENIFEQQNQHLNYQRKNMTDELGNFVFHQQAQQETFIDKLNKLTTVFEKISGDMKIKQYIEQEELVKIRNILSFLSQVKLKIEDDKNNSSLKQAYIQELQSFISGFGDDKNYDDYYQDLYLQALQREQQEAQEKQSQQEESKQQQDPQNSQEEQQNQQEETQPKESFSFSDYIKSSFLKGCQSINSFMKNPLNILRCLLLALSLLFFSSYFSIPDMTNQPQSEIFNWLAYNRESRMLVATGSLSFCSFILFGVRQLYIVIIGPLRNDQEKAVLNLFLEQNPILHISIIYMTDPNIIPQKFDLAIWLCFYFTFSTFKIFHSICSQELKMILQNINDDYQEELRCIKKIQRFSAILFLVNLWICAIGLWAFSMSGYYKLSLLFYEGILFGFDSFKIILCATKLCDHMNFYVNYNTEEIHDPFFKRETLFDSFYHIVQLFHFIQLIYNYFFKLDYQFIMHLWLLYLFKKINISLRQLKNNFQAYNRYRNIQLNLDIMFPKVDIKELQSDDVCSICHDELIVARRIETCGHKFHIKCLFKWLKSQQNSRCPICRSEIPNLNFDNIPNKPGILTSALDFLARFLMPTINFIFEPRAPQQIENQGGNNQNDENENNNQEVQGDEQHNNQQQSVQNINGQVNQEERQLINNNTNLNIEDILNQNIFEGDERDVLMYQHLSQLILSQNQNKKPENESQDDEMQQLQSQRQTLRQNIYQIFKQRVQESQLQKENTTGHQNKQYEYDDDDEEYVDDDEEYEEGQEGYENLEYHQQDLQGNYNQRYDNEMSNMKQTKEQLLNLQNEFLSLQDVIMQKDSNIDTELVLKQFQQRLEREQSKLINFLMKKIILNEEQSNLQNQNQIQNEQTIEHSIQEKEQTDKQNVEQIIQNVENCSNQIEQGTFQNNQPKIEVQLSEDVEHLQKQEDEEEEKFSEDKINSNNQIQDHSVDLLKYFEQPEQLIQLKQEGTLLNSERDEFKDKEGGANLNFVQEEYQIKEQDKIPQETNLNEEFKQNLGMSQTEQEEKIKLDDSQCIENEYQVESIQDNSSNTVQLGINVLSTDKQYTPNIENDGFDLQQIEEIKQQQPTNNIEQQNNKNDESEEKLILSQENYLEKIDQKSFTEETLDKETHIDCLQENMKNNQDSEE